MNNILRKRFAQEIEADIEYEPGFNLFCAIIKSAFEENDIKYFQSQEFIKHASYINVDAKYILEKLYETI